jgi:HB1, ASXL, restriction endonuclease HTH domain
VPDAAARGALPVSANTEGDPKMATSKNGKKQAAPAKAAKAQAKKAAAGKSGGSAQPKKLSALDAAAKVLGETGKAMNCQELIETMAAKGYWKSPAGKTPSATLYASIIKEIATKGKESRFQKTDRGTFART